MQPKSLQRTMMALSKKGLEVEFHDSIWSIRLASKPDAPPATILLPQNLRLEGKAALQLAQLAAVVDPSGGGIHKACATPDFHPGDSGVAIGSVIQSPDVVIPSAVGSDINCGMRLHVAELSEEQFLERRNDFVQAMKGDYFFGSRDIQLDRRSAEGLFRFGLTGWLTEMLDSPLGAIRKSDRNQLSKELERVFLEGSLEGDPRWAPEGHVPKSGVFRDPALATIGGGNHFVEVQVLEEVLDGRLGFAWGLRPGMLGFMIHSGSRSVGQHIGRAFRDWAREAWPVGLAYPEGHLFPLSRSRTPELFNQYLEAEATAAHYGFLNRLLLAELLRLRLREFFGDVEAPLVYDLPHNITLSESGGWVTRKGACPAYEDQPVILPGSMGTASYLLVGRGASSMLASASHGAGRASSRHRMKHGRASEEELGLTGVDCVALRPERRIEEAPVAYKPVSEVVDCQVQKGTVDVVARFRPLLTFKA